MSDVQNYILLAPEDVTRAKAFAEKTAKDLEAQKTTLIEVVQSLGPFINEDDAQIRARTIEYLSDVIGYLPSSFLSRQQTQVICKFMCDRIEDGGALSGLLKLQQSQRFNASMAQMTFRAIVGGFQDLQIRPQVERLAVLSVLNDLMSHHRDALKQLGSECLDGITDLVSGEKDPRNLMIVFSILRVLMVEWDISKSAETLFEAVFCYFPITFRPPPNDPYGVTAQDLKDRLRDCIAASQLFAPYVFPQLIDKLDSTSPNVQRDVLKTLTACVSSYGWTTVSNYSVTLWDALKFEILNMQEEDLAESALECLEAIAQRLTQQPSPSNAQFTLGRYIKTVLKDCQEQFQEPTHKQAKPAATILHRLSKVSHASFDLVIKPTIPPLMTLYKGADSIATQRALLEILNQFFDSAISLYGTAASPPSPTTGENPLEPFKDDFFEIGSQVLMGVTAEEVSFRIVALKLLLKLCLLRNYLQNGEIGMVVQYLDEIILGEDPNGREDLRRETNLALLHIAEVKPGFIMDITLPAFMARLPDSPSPETREYVVTLEALAQLSSQKSISDTVIRRLLNRLEAVLPNCGDSNYLNALLTTIYYILSQRDLAGDGDVGYYYERVVVKLFSRIALASTGKGQTTPLNEPHALELLGRVATRLVHALRTHQQQVTSYQIYSLFLNEQEFAPVPFGATRSDNERATMILSTSLLAGLYSKIAIMSPNPGGVDYQRLLSELVRLALIEESPVIQRTILRQIALIANKFLPQSDIQHAVNMLEDMRSKLFKTDKSPENSNRVVFWLAKALVLRLTNINGILHSLLELLAVQSCSLMAARGFNLLLAPDEILSKENGATVRLLARQKVFSICIPAISQGFRNAEAAIKPNYLVALSGIIKYVPTEVVMTEIESLLPLLLQSLDLKDLAVKAATIDTLAVVSRESPAAIEGHFGSLVTRLLRSIGDSKSNSANVRYHSLLCLGSFPGRARESILLPHRTTVTRGLMVALDDAKRHVRKAAVDCKAAWLKLDEPASD